MNGNAHKPDEFVPKLARNELFYFIARVCMIMSLPLIGFFGTRTINQADALQLTVIQQNVELRVLSAQVKDRLDTDVKQLSDHELRLRSLERK